MLDVISAFSVARYKDGETNMSSKTRNNHLRVLSIDFDYFQTVDKDTLFSCYPDGIDLSTHLSTIVWASYYANPTTEKKLQAISINEDELYTMESILCEQDTSIPVMISQSHRHIYDFIINWMERSGRTNEDGLCVSNVDMHHDFRNGNKELDCGNWISHLNEKYPSMGIEWIANPVSKTMYRLDRWDDKDLIKYKVSDMRETEFDAIFLCRSDNWLPPHLDIYFSEFCETIASHFTNVQYEKGILDLREYEELAAEERKLIERQICSKKRGKGERGE